MDGPGGTGFKGREMPGSPHHGGQGEFAAGRAAGIPMPSVPDDTPMMVLGGVVVVVLFIIWIYIQLNPPERRRFLSVPTTKQVDLTSQKGRDLVRRSLTEPDGPYAKISDKEREELLELLDELDEVRQGHAARQAESDKRLAKVLEHRMSATRNNGGVDPYTTVKSITDLLRKFGLKLRKPPSLKEMQNTIEWSEFFSKYAKAGALLTTGRYAEDDDDDTALLLSEESEEDEAERCAAAKGKVKVK